MQIEIPDELAAAVAEIAATTGQDIDGLVSEMVTEAIKMRRVPGIVFADGATGRRARVGGTGIEVFEVIDLYELFGRDRQKVQESLPQLDTYQINMAIAYYEAYPEDIAPRLKSDEQVQAELEALWAKHPKTSPHGPGRLRQASGASSSTSSKRSA